MTEKEVIEIVRTHIESQFPKTCSNCGRQYVSLKDYLLNTTHQGDPVSYDADIGLLFPDPPIGAISHANCSCGNTLAIISSGMSKIIMWRLLQWARKESKHQGISVSELLSDLRRKIDEQVLGKTDV